MQPPRRSPSFTQASPMRVQATSSCNGSCRQAWSGRGGEGKRVGETVGVQVGGRERARGGGLGWGVESSGGGGGGGGRGGAHQAMLQWRQLNKTHDFIHEGLYGMSRHPLSKSELSAEVKSLSHGGLRRVHVVLLHIPAHPSKAGLLLGVAIHPDVALNLTTCHAMHFFAFFYNISFHTIFFHTIFFLSHHFHTMQQCQCLACHMYMRVCVFLALPCMSVAMMICCQRSQETIPAVPSCIACSQRQ